MPEREEAALDIVVPSEDPPRKDEDKPLGETGDSKGKGKSLDNDKGKDDGPDIVGTILP